MTPTNAKPSQDFVPIKEVRDGIVVLKDSGLRAILIASSLNFALKSADEQTAILSQFQNFLNSLDFSIQIFIESRQLDIRPYVALLESKYKEQTAELLKIQTREYIDFVKSFVESANIMTKNFFIVVPYAPPVLGVGKGGIPILPTFGKQTKAQASATFEESRTQLEQRIAVVEQGLVRTGVRVATLGTEEAIELYYKLFNPGELEKPLSVEQ